MPGDNQPLPWDAPAWMRCDRYGHVLTWSESNTTSDQPPVGSMNCSRCGAIVRSRTNG